MYNVANKDGADQSVHPCSLISNFVVRLLERIISRLATSKIAFLLLVSVAEETDFSLGVSETPKISYMASGPILSNGPQSAHQFARGPIVGQNCMLAGMFILLNS